MGAELGSGHMWRQPDDWALFEISMLSGGWLRFDTPRFGQNGARRAFSSTDIKTGSLDTFGDFLSAEYPGCFTSAHEAVSLFGRLAFELEKDECLRVPSEAVAPGLRGALGDGGLSGLSLLGLAACGAAITLRKREDAYLLIYDCRLSIGIPGFFDLCARMVRDLRMMNPNKGATSSVGPSSVVFLGKRIIEADGFFGDVLEPVPGVQRNPLVINLDLDATSRGVTHSERGKALGKEAFPGDVEDATRFVGVLSQAYGMAAKGLVDTLAAAAYAKSLTEHEKKLAVEREKQCVGVQMASILMLAYRESVMRLLGVLTEIVHAKSEVERENKLDS